MQCEYPIPFYKAHSPNEKTGKFPLVFSLKDASPDRMHWLPCRNCLPCRVNKKREWATRAMAEGSLYEHNEWVTLTYAPENLPKDGSVSTREMSLFMKRFRKLMKQETGQTGIRFMATGEYGDKLGRPHYHLILFNCFLPDKKIFKAKPGFPGEYYYRSALLDRAWSLKKRQIGHATIGKYSSHAARYIASYVVKKMNGKKAELHYMKHDPQTGEILLDPQTGDPIMLNPEFCTMSTTPGIGAPFYKKYKNDIYPADKLVLRDGREIRSFKVPAYFDKLYAADLEKDGIAFDHTHPVKKARLKRMFDHRKSGEASTQRLIVKGEIQRQKFEHNQRSGRSLDNMSDDEYRFWHEPEAIDSTDLE